MSAKYGVFVMLLLPSHPPQGHHNSDHQHGTISPGNQSRQEHGDHGQGGKATKQQPIYIALRF
eukprot:4186126-Pyramimonas_sp.AAC.1